MEISREVRLLISEYKFKPVKHLGQNFLVSASALNFIVDAIAPEKDKTYIEVGPGFSILTKEVSKRAKFIYAIEKDERFREFYSENPIDNVQFIIADALQEDFDRLGADEIFGNIPYYISSLLLLKIARSKINRAVLLLQDEFAARILASHNTKEYGSITVAIQFFFDVKFLKRFPPSFFFPRPDVYSTLIELKRVRAYDPTDEAYIEFIHKVFNHRRKKLISNMKSLYGVNFVELFKSLDIDESARPDDIAQDKYFELYENMVKFYKRYKEAKMEYKVLEGLYYSKDDEWVKVDGDIATIGITDYAQDKLGDLVFIAEVEVGKKFKKGESILTVESVKAASDIYAPISGEVVEVNSKAVKDPSILNSDPYGEGWLLKLKIENPDELKELMDKPGYEEYRKE